MIEWIIPSEDSGKKLITFLTERMEEKYSARRLKSMIESNLCKINGRVERFASTHVVKGDHISFMIDELATKIQHLVDIKSRILFEDQYFLIFDKPPDINSDEKGILSLLRKYHKNLLLVHRLDRDTTGVLIFAKNKEIYQQMVEQFKKLAVKKCYITIVDGVVKEEIGHIDNFLGKKHVYAGQTIWGSVKKDEGLHAHTDWVRKQKGKEASLLYCYPQTGRTHQIRVHMAEMCHPILGDYQYCKKFKCKYQPKRTLLHALNISFIHPITHAKMEIEAKIPADFKEAQKSLF